MGTKFTKGEWRAVIVTTPNGFFERVTIEKGESICNITTRNSERAEANANLIAAAPELLEALILMVDTYSKIGIHAANGSMNKAQNAINKATK